MNSSLNSTLWIGHTETTRRLMEMWRRGRMPHALIFSGPKGIGKATCAYHLARMALSRAQEFVLPESHPVRARVAAGSHADLLVVETGEGEESKSREITVDAIRSVAAFMPLTPSEGKWRVVIIDGAEEMNTNAANALLKTLEEPPPHALLILVSHNPGRLLPTIRSRCRTIAFQPPAEQEYRTTLEQVAPDIDADTVAWLGQLTRFSPGLAVEYHEKKALELYQSIIDLLRQAPRCDPAALQALSGAVTSKQSMTGWRLVTELTLYALSGIHQPDRPEIVEGERAALTHLAGLQSPAAWAKDWFRVRENFMLAEGLHLDYKSLLIGFFTGIGTEELRLPA